MLITTSDTEITVKLSGEIDHHSALPIRTKVDSAITMANPKQLILDFSKVSFMDSSGVGLVIGRYKKARAKNCRLIVQGLSARDEKMMKLSGLQKMVEFR